VRGALLQLVNKSDRLIKLAQSATTKRFTLHTGGKHNMVLLLLEALLALGVFVGIIYWTMFSGRKRGELSEMNTPHEEGADQRDERKDSQGH
jgi:hypothetical protein